MAGSQDPTAGSTAWSLTTHGISENLFTVDKTSNVVGVLAESVTKVSEFVWTVKLNTGSKFSDGSAVTGQAVADCLKELNEKNSASVRKSPFATKNLLEDTDGLRRPPLLRGATQSISALSMR